MVYLIDPKEVCNARCKRYCALFIKCPVDCPFDWNEPLYGIPT